MCRTYWHITPRGLHGRAVDEPTAHHAPPYRRPRDRPGSGSLSPRYHNTHNTFRHADLAPRRRWR
jgi:hypothetical protein